MLDMPTQGKAMVEGFARLQGELIADEAHLSGLEQIYTENNSRVRTMKARVDELKKQLSRVIGAESSSVPTPAMGTAETGDFPSIRKLPLLGETYLSLYRESKLQEAIYEILTKQYELAKINEAKEQPVVRVLDAPQVPERKSSPQRILITLAGGLTAAFVAVFYLRLRQRWYQFDVGHPVRLAANEIGEGLLSDWQTAREGLRPKSLLARLRHTTDGQTDSNTQNHSQSSR